MQKLTQSEAKDLIEKAWKQVSEHTLGSYRFGQSLWNLIPEDILKQYWKDSPFGLDSGWVRDVDFFYERNSDIALAKFYQYFVEDSNNQLDSEQH